MGVGGRQRRAKEAGNAGMAPGRQRRAKEAGHAGMAPAAHRLPPPATDDGGGRRWAAGCESEVK